MRSEISTFYSQGQKISDFLAVIATPANILANKLTGKRALMNSRFLTEYCALIIIKFWIYNGKD